MRIIFFCTPDFAFAKLMLPHQAGMTARVAGGEVRAA